MNLRKESPQRTKMLYEVIKLALKTKAKEKNVGDVLMMIADEYGYENHFSLWNLYRKQRKNDSNPLPEFKIFKKKKQTED